MQEKDESKRVMKELPVDMKPLLNGVNISTPGSANLKYELDCLWQENVCDIFLKTLNKP